MHSFRCVTAHAVRFKRCVAVFSALMLLLPTAHSSLHASQQHAQTRPINATPAECTQSFSDDFSTDPNSDSRWNIFRYADDREHEAVWDGQSETFFLTKTAGDMGVAAFANYSLQYTRWQARFRYKSGGGTGADGFVFMFYKDAAKYGLPGYGGFLGFQFAFGDGIPGYGVEFDNYYNPYDGIGDPSANHIAVIQDTTGNHLAYVNDERTEDDQWHPVVITYTDGAIVVNVDGQDTLTYRVAQPSYAYTGVGFSSATALYDNNHAIDDFALSVDCASMFTPNTLYLPVISR